MEYHREDTEGVESPIETEENISTSSEDQKESGPGESAIKLETVEAWPDNQKNEIKRSSSQRLLDWLSVTGRQPNRIIQTFRNNIISREKDLTCDRSPCRLAIFCCCSHTLP